MLNIYAAIEKVDREQKLVFGYASTEALDQQGEIVTIEALEAALPEYMRFANIREMHQPSAVGIAREVQIDAKGLWLGAHVVDERAWEKVRAGVYKGFSIGGRVTQRAAQNRKIITGVDLTEISLVDRPANPEAIFEMMKRAEGALRPQPSSKWDCGIAAHRHSGEREAATCMEQQMSSTRAAAVLQTANALIARLDDAAKRVYPPAERQRMAAQGEALPDGSFPIRDRADLAAAIHDYGRARDPAAARAHIIARAQALDATAMLPAEWQEGTQPGLHKRADGLAKGLHLVACLAQVLDEIRWLQQGAVAAQLAGTAANDAMVARLGAWFDDGAGLLRDVVAEATDALGAQEEGDAAGAGVDELAVAKAAAGRAWPLSIAAALRDSIVAKSFAEPAVARRRRLAESFEKLGARNSKADLAHLQKIHDHAVDLGASCPLGKHLSSDAAVESLEKIAARVTPVMDDLDALKKRLAIVEAMPLPPRAVLGAVAVSKEEDRDSFERPQFDARLALLPPGPERAGEILRHAYYVPRSAR